MKMYSGTSTSIETKSVSEAVTQVMTFLEEARLGKNRVMFSLTGLRHEGYYQGSQQFRCWSGPFGGVTWDYFDSNGRDLLFTIDANKEEMEEFIKSLEVLRGYRKWILEEPIVGCLYAGKFSGQPVIWVGGKH